MTGQHEALFQQPADIDLLLLRQSAAARSHRDDGIAAEALHGEVQIGRTSIEDREIHLAAMQPFDEMAAIAFDDAKRNAGKGLDAAAGKAIFDKSCVSCHGNDGKGNPAIAKVLGEKGLNLTAKEATQKSDGELMKVIAEGEGKMPAFKSLSQDEQKQVVTYIRSLGK